MSRKNIKERERVEQSRNICFFPMFCGSGWASRLAKAAGAGPSGGMRGVKLHAPSWRKANFQIKLSKTTSGLERFCHNLDAAVARSTFPSQNVKTHHLQKTFGRSSIVLLGRCNGFCSLSRVSQTCGSCSSFKNYCRRGFGEERNPSFFEPVNLDFWRKSHILSHTCFFADAWMDRWTDGWMDG